MGRSRIDDDIVRRLGIEWIRPAWLEGQLDRESLAFVPRGRLPMTNVTGRNWTLTGVIGSTRRAIVDPGGLVTPWFGGWSLDWWIGADDRWHFPSREQSVRQRLVDDSPIIETAMRIPGGDAVQRAYAFRGDEEMVVVEVENRSTVPFAVAFAVRPYNPESLVVVERIAIHDRTVFVDGRPALLFPSPPRAMAGSTFHDGDSVHLVTSGAAGPALPQPLRCDVGMAQAAFVFPLPHTAVLRVAMPMTPEGRTRRRSLMRRWPSRVPVLSGPLPSAAEVSKGWAAQSRRGLRLELPEGSLADAVEANRRYLLLFHDGKEVTPGPQTDPRSSFRDAVYLLAAMDRYGFSRESAEVIKLMPSRQHRNGFFFSSRQEWDSNGAALYAMGEHWRLTRDLEAIDLDSVEQAVKWIDRKRTSRRRRKDPSLRGPMPAGVSAEHLGPFDYFYWDALWSINGLRDGSELLAAGGRAQEAEQARVWADEMLADLRTTGAPAASAAVIRDRFCLGTAFYQGISPTGLGTYLTMQLAQVELAAGDRRALDRLQWMLEAATTTFTWPEAIHPQLGGGCLGDGHHGRAVAAFLSLVRDLLVREVDGGLALLSMIPPAWHGQPLEVHDAPTHFGLLSYAVRWHGARPALLWELRPHEGVSGVRITAPGLDPSWSTQDEKGEVLLASFEDELDGR